MKLAVLLGLFTAYQSWKSLGAAIVLAIGIGGVIAVAALITRRRGRKDVIPFGPAMVAGAFLALTVGESLADWYLG